MSLQLSNVDKNYLKSIFTEDIFIINDNTPSIKDTILPSTAKQFGVVLNNKEELNIYKDFLTKIFQSIQVDFKDVDFLFKEASLKKGSYATLFSFGIPSSALQLNLKEKQYEILVEANHRFLFADSIGDIEKTLDKKKLLWAALKKLI